MRIGNVLALCLQADAQGLLQGDLNLAQIAAMAIVRKYRLVERHEERRSTMDYVDDIVGVYLKLNHPQAYEEVERARMQEALERKDPDAELIAEDMAELYEKLTAMEG